MTKMIIDNKATAKRAYEVYEIDTNIYDSENKLRELVGDCMNKEVYMITIMKDNETLFTVRNYQ